MLKKPDLARDGRIDSTTRLEVPMAAALCREKKSQNAADGLLYRPRHFRGTWTN